MDSFALTWSGRRYSPRDLEGEISRWIDRLAAAGVGGGDRIATLCGNRLELVAIFLALGRLGAALAPINTRLTRAEVEPLVAKIDPRLLIAEAALADRAPSSFEPMPDAGGLQFWRGSSPVREPDRGVRAILFTSGTTGTPKAAQLTAGNFAASAEASGANLGSSSDQRWLACLPLFHVGGLAMVARCAAYGAEMILHSSFEAGAVNRAIDAGEVTHLSLVANTLARLLKDRSGRALPSTLRAILVGGGPVPSALLEAAGALGAPALPTYGLTEACSQVATALLGGPATLVVLPGFSMRVVDEEGRSVEQGEVGEIEIEGPAVMPGYWGEPPRTSGFRTGDLGTLDERGQLSVLARRTDLILSGGENIYPAEVEGVLMQCPGVIDAVVVGRADDTWGQVPWALVAGAIDASAIERWCRERLASFKVPRRFVPVEAIPRGVTGKLDRQAAGVLLD